MEERLEDKVLARIAHQVEQFPCKDQAVGSSPAAGTKITEGSVHGGHTVLKTAPLQR